MSATHYAAETQTQEREVAFLAVRLVAFAELLGLVPPSREAGIDQEQVLRALDAFAQVGVSRRNAVLSRPLDSNQMAAVLHESLGAIEGSPLPELEWGPLTTMLGDDQTAKLVGSSVSSVLRYRSGERPTPDQVADRLHTIALIVADLAGSYNDYGVRRWFSRPRSVLEGKAPADSLTGDWSPEQPRPQQVRALARALVGSSAT